LVRELSLGSGRNRQLQVAELLESALLAVLLVPRERLPVDPLKHQSIRATDQEEEREQRQEREDHKGNIIQGEGDPHRDQGQREPDEQDSSRDPLPARSQRTIVPLLFEQLVQALLLLGHDPLEVPGESGIRSARRACISHVAPPARRSTLCRQ
jgi:hypothetical protein